MLSKSSAVPSASDEIQDDLSIRFAPSALARDRLRVVARGLEFAEGFRAPIDTRDEKADNSPVGSKRGQNIVGKHTGRRSAPTTVNSSVRTREYLTTAEIERTGHRPATRSAGRRTARRARLGV
jgi:hypothetical protein